MTWYDATLTLLENAFDNPSYHPRFIKRGEEEAPVKVVWVQPDAGLFPALEVGKFNENERQQAIRSLFYFAETNPEKTYVAFCDAIGIAVGEWAQRGKPSNVVLGITSYGNDSDDKLAFYLKHWEGDHRVIQHSPSWPKFTDIQALKLYYFTGLVIAGMHDPVHPDTIRKTIKYAQEYGVAVNFMGWGDWWPYGQGAEHMFTRPGGLELDKLERYECPLTDSSPWPSNSYRLGPENSGNLLDGQKYFDRIV